MNPDININPELPYRRFEQKSVIDVRTFKPHEIKEIDMWAWKKMKHEKWFVQLDCITKKLKTWKLHNESN